MEIKRLWANSTNYTKGRSDSIKYIVVHYTANNGDTAYGNCMYFTGANRDASAHYFVDSKEIWQSVADYNTAWHCGAKKYYNSARNANSIGVELCSLRDSNGKYYFSEDTLKNGAELIRYLMAEYKIPIDRVVRHYDVTRKICPAPLISEREWLNFKERLVKNMSYEEAIKVLVSKGVVESREYWDNAVKCVKYLDRLIINMAEKL